jgi:hypothetical protein
MIPPRQAAAVNRELHRHAQKMLENKNLNIQKPGVYKSRYPRLSTESCGFLL